MCKSALDSQQLLAKTRAVQSAVLALPLGTVTERYARWASLFEEQARLLALRIREAPRRAWTLWLTAQRTPRFWAAVPAAIGLLGALAYLPGVWSGLGDDDILQRGLLAAGSVSEVASDLYIFLQPSTNLAGMDVGVLPWWTLPTVRVAFWRPLSAFTLWLDYRVWPATVELMRAHSLAWYAILCALAAALYRRLAGRVWPALLAALLFALSVTHYDVASSLSARNIILTGIFALLALLLHDRWRRQRWLLGAVLAPVCTALSLLASESGVATGAFLLAYALFIDDDTLGRRFASVLPHVAILAGWQVLYQTLGYGAYGSGIYIDPSQEPLRFLASAVEHIPVLLAGQWLAPDPAVYTIFAPGWRRVWWILAVIFVVALGWLFHPLLRKDRLARFWGLGMLLSLAPLCSVRLPSGRHLLFVGLGAFGLLAQLTQSCGLRSPIEGGRFGGASLRRAGCIFLVGLHGILYPTAVSASRELLDPRSRSMIDLSSVPSDAEQTCVVVNAPSPGQLMYIPSYGRLLGEPVPNHLRALAPAHTSVRITRTGPDSIIVAPQGGYLQPPGMWTGTVRDWLPAAHAINVARYGDELFRSSSFPLEAGQWVHLSGLNIAITEDDDGRPLEASMAFDAPLDSPAFTWWSWDWHQERYVPFPLPAIGETRIVPGPF